MKPKFGSAFLRHSPDATKVTQTLQETTDFEGYIKPDDVICYSCYIMSEEERVPSYTALWRHWKRVCWVSEMWNNSPQQDVMKEISLTLGKTAVGSSQPITSTTIEWESLLK